MLADGQAPRRAVVRLPLCDRAVTLRFQMEDENEFNPKARRLCPDGSCVGLIGPDGRCRVCGTAAGPATDGAALEADVDVEAIAPPMSAALPVASDGGFDPKRRLCDDGACVGVVGPDGKCNVCGKASGVSGS